MLQPSISGNRGCWLLNWMIKCFKMLPGLVGLNFCCGIWRIWSEFDINNRSILPGHFKNEKMPVIIVVTSMLVYCLISLWLSWQLSRLLTGSKYISQKIILYFVFLNVFFFFWMSMVSSCKSLTYNIYTLFCIIHLHLHTQSQKSITSEKWIHLDFLRFCRSELKRICIHSKHENAEGRRFFLLFFFTLGLFHAI